MAAGKSLGTLTLDLIARTGSFEAGMTKAERASSRASRKIASDAEKAAARYKAAFSAIGAIGLGFSVREVGQYADAFTGLQNRLRLVTDGQGELGQSTADLFDISMRTAQSIDSTAQVYQRFAQNAGRLGLSLKDVADVTDTVAKAVAISGASAASAEAALVQFGQAIASGVLRGQELNSVMEQTPGLAMAIADGLGVTIGQLRALAAEGEITADALIKALRNSADSVDEKFATRILTIGQAFTNVDTAITKFVGSADTAIGASSAIAGGIDTVAKGFASLADSERTFEVIEGAAVALALVISSRLAASVTLSGVRFTAATIEALRYQSALATMAGVSGRAAIGITAVSAAARAGAGALALMGGPVGAAILAASALTYFATRSSEAEREAEALDGRINKLDASFKTLTINQAAAALADYAVKLIDAEDEARKVAAQVETLNKNVAQFPNSPSAKEWRADLVHARANLDTASQAVAVLHGKIEQLNVIMGASPAAIASVAAASEEYTKLAAKLDEQILLIGKKTDAEKLAARIGAGLIEGLIAGEGEALVSKQLVIDAAKEEEEAQKQRESAAKSAASAAASAAKAAIERAASEAKAVQESVAALIQQSEQLGWTASAVKLYDLESKGATEGQLALAAAALEATDAFAEQEKVNAEAKGVIASLMGEEEAIRASYERRKELILETTLATEEEKAELLRELKERTDEELLELNGSYWERYLAAAEESLTSFDELAASVVENFSSQFGNAFESMVFDAENLGDAVSGMAEGMARSIINALGQMAAQWLAYQAVQLIVGKTTQASGATALAANASATALQAGLAAFASTAAIPVVGPFLAPAAMGAALAVTTPLAAAVGLTAMAGMAHDGIDSVPQTGTWLLEKGERVVTSETSAKLDATLSRIEAGRSGGGVTVNQIEDKSRAGQVEQSMNSDGEMEINMFVADIRGAGRRSKALEATYGLVRRGS